MKMLKTAVLTTVLAVGAMIGAAAAGIGVVNVDQAAASHPKYQKMVQELQNIDKKYEAQTKAMFADLEKMPEAQQQTAIQGKYAPLISEILGAKAKAQEPIIKALEKAVEKVRLEKKLDAILVAPVQVATKAPEEQVIDVTADVQKALR